MDKWHGTAGGYSNHKCRCDDCRVAWNNYASSRRKRLWSEYVYDSGGSHGTDLEYNRGCKCEPCKSAHARYAAVLRRGLASTTGACAICEVTTRLVWDHDHATGEHRGWLCLNCNQGLGLMRDDTRLLFKAVEYLSRGGVK